MGIPRDAKYFFASSNILLSAIFHLLKTTEHIIPRYKYNAKTKTVVEITAHFVPKHIN